MGNFFFYPCPPNLRVRKFSGRFAPQHLFKSGIKGYCSNMRCITHFEQYLSRKTAKTVPKMNTLNTFHLNSGSGEGSGVQVISKHQNGW